MEFQGGIPILKYLVLNSQLFKNWPAERVAQKPPWTMDQHPGMPPSIDPMAVLAEAGLEGINPEANPAGQGVEAAAEVEEQLQADAAEDEALKVAARLKELMFFDPEETDKAKESYMSVKLIKEEQTLRGESVAGQNRNSELALVQEPDPCRPVHPRPLTLP